MIACRFVGLVVPYIPDHWPGGALTQWLIAFAIIVIGVMLVAGVANALLSRLVQVSGLSGIDRSLGLMFGLVRGVVLVLILVALAGLTELPQQEFWRNALLRPYAEQGRARVEAVASRNARRLRPRVTHVRCTGRDDQAALYGEVRGLRLIPACIGFRPAQASATRRLLRHRPPL